jgi:hypothetical protein
MIETITRFKCILYFTNLIRIHSNKLKNILQELSLEEFSFIKI